jgi:hypothetical protein
MQLPIYVAQQAALAQASAEQAARQVIELRLLVGLCIGQFVTIVLLLSNLKQRTKTTERSTGDVDQESS